MRASRKLTAAICQVLIGLLLSTQVAFATQPCVEAGMSAAAALATTEDHECCETSVSERTLCAMKCIDGTKVSAHPPLSVPLASSQAVLRLAAIDGTGTELHAASLYTPARGPPKTIRFCSFLI